MKRNRLASLCKADANVRIEKWFKWCTLKSSSQFDDDHLKSKFGPKTLKRCNSTNAGTPTYIFPPLLSHINKLSLSFSLYLSNIFIFSSNIYFNTHTHTHTHTNVKSHPPSRLQPTHKTKEFQAHQNCCSFLYHKPWISNIIPNKISQFLN